jgi:hypothetical protein
MLKVETAHQLATVPTIIKTEKWPKGSGLMSTNKTADFAGRYQQK